MEKLRWLSAALVVTAMLVMAHFRATAGVVSGDLKKWHRVTIAFDGPNTNETADPNPFRDYRLNVTFAKGNKAVTVPGFFAADGNAAETSAAGGNKWRVHFTPDEEGAWTYRASFRTGADVAVSLDPQAGTPTAFDGDNGSFQVGPSDKSGRDFRSKGLLQYVGKHYLRFAEAGDYFIKGGADSPENFLAYLEFDGAAEVAKTTDPKARKLRQGEAAPPVERHKYQPHAADWKAGDPTWQGGKGKNIIGALNYLSAKGVNSVYFLTMNVGGDGRDVWPWTTDAERYRFDCSKLDQWEIVFSHMDAVGLMLHVVLEEQENDQFLDGGDLGTQRKLYFRELIARFGHHLAVTWNLGEENTNTDAQRKDFARFIHDLDPYDHLVVVHTFPGQYDVVYTPLLGYEHFEGPSLQMGDMSKTHEETIKWLDRSDKAGRPWVVCLDEIGPSDTGVKPDADDPGHDSVRKQALWGNLMAGGGGVEWYFGYKFPNNDLNCDDFRSRDRMWDQTRVALDFFQKYLPFTEMKHNDALTSSAEDYCLAKVGEVYAVYLPNGGTTGLDLGSATGEFAVQWYNPRAGGPLRDGTVTKIAGPGARSIGLPPSGVTLDWVGLVKRR
jgi:hypothetical protein